MQSDDLIKQYNLVDIITVGTQNYAISLTNQPVPGCVTVPTNQMHTLMKDFLAKGYSQRYKKLYSTITGITSWMAFYYSLEKLPATRKQIFSHALSGTAKRPGLLEEWGAQKLGKGAFLVPIGKEKDATAFLARWGVDYTREVMLRV